MNGDGRHELYRQLVDTADSEGHSGDIRWNFEKFLLGGEGNVIARFSPMQTPDSPEVTEAIEAAIG